MSTDSNRELVKSIFAELANGNSGPLLESLSDDVCWTVMGSTKWSRTFEGKQAVLSGLLGPLRSRFATQYTATARRFIADGEMVVVEARGNVVTKSGMPYNNAYCWIYRIEGGKIREITEYLDTELVTAALGDPDDVSAA